MKGEWIEKPASFPALALAAVPTVLAWQHFQVEQDYHALWMLLHRARTQAAIHLQAAPTRALLSA